MAETAAEGSKRARASMPKVKTGCITCKVKCDETKPGCLRCQRFGRTCDGYAQPIAPRSTTPVAIQPKPAILQPQTTSTSHYDALPATSAPYLEVDYCGSSLDDLETTSSESSSYFGTDLWRNIVEQESQATPAIRHATMALEVLTRTMQDSTFDPTSSSYRPAVIEDHGFILKQYQNAIANLQQHLSSQIVPDPRTSLVAAYLFVCAENLTGNFEAADRQLLTAISLLQQYVSQNESSATRSPISSGSSRRSSPVPVDSQRLEGLMPNEVSEMLASVDIQQTLQHQEQFSNELNVTFSQGFNFFDPHQTANVPALVYTPPDNPITPLMPPTFSGISEAKQAWGVLMQKCQIFQAASAPLRRLDAIIRPEWMEQERDTIITSLQHFQNALEGLLALSGNETVIWDDAATVLYLCAKASCIYLYAGSRAGEMTYDVFNKEYETIVLRSKNLIEYSKTNGSNFTGMFAFELGIVPPLHLTALKCRDLKIRREAIALLLQSPRKEGAWDGVMLGNIDTWLMDLEEEGMDAFGLIPETSRWRLAEVKRNTSEGWVSAKAHLDGVSADGVWRCALATRETRVPL